jgi:hypothetical protein
MTQDKVQQVLEARRQHFEDKREGRIERFEQAAANAAQRSDAYYKRSGEGLPEFGQPILVGHHSEKRHRIALAKAHNAMDKSVEEGKKADYYADKVEAAKSNTSISSDNPDALFLLKEKLESLEAEQAHYKKVNKAVKSAKFKKLTDAVEKINFVREAVECTYAQAAQHIAGHGLAYQGSGYPAYVLTNNNSNMTRIKTRIKDLEKSLEAIADEGEAKEIRIEELGVTVFHNHVESRYQLDFDRRLTRDSWDLLAKQNSFRKTREGLFQRQLNTLSTLYMLEKGDKPYSLYRSLKELADANNLFVDGNG